MLRVRKLISAAVLLASGLILLVVALPAQACRPCVCPTNTSINCYGDYALYTHVDKRGNCAIEVLGINPKTGKPRPALYVTANALAKIPDLPEKNTLIKSYYEFSLFKLTTGEYQLNVGPDFENKVHVIIWTGCPAQNPYESSFISEQQ
jgi:hypothetical protein